MKEPLFNFYGRTGRTPFRDPSLNGKSTWLRKKGTSIDNITKECALINRRRLTTDYEFPLKHMIIKRAEEAQKSFHTQTRSVGWWVGEATPLVSTWRECRHLYRRERERERERERFLVGGPDTVIIGAAEKAEAKKMERHERRCLID